VVQFLVQLLVREPYGVVQSFSKVIQPSLLMVNLYI
jgi:hypothetical protein